MMSSIQTTLPKRSFTLAKSGLDDIDSKKLWCAEIIGHDKKYIFERKFLKPTKINEFQVVFQLKENVPYHCSGPDIGPEYFLMPTNGKKRRLTIDQVKVWLDGQGIIENDHLKRKNLFKINFIFGKQLNACNVSK